MTVKERSNAILRIWTEQIKIEAILIDGHSHERLGWDDLSKFGFAPSKSECFLTSEINCDVIPCSQNCSGRFGRILETGHSNELH
jgi:hypothetical protein